MIDSASDEINLLLPLAFGLIVLFLLSIISLICWILFRFKIVEISNKSYLLGALKDGFLSILSVFALVAIIGGLVFVINIVISFFK